jgi:hypothetical protein
MRGKVDGQLDVPEHFMSELRGHESTPPAAAELLPCRNPVLPTALRPQQQLALTKQATFAFLQSQFHPVAALRQQYKEILEHTLAQENPEVEVMTGQ